MDTITTDSGKVLKLEEAYTVDKNDVEIRWASDWGEEDTYEVNVATDVIRVKRVWVLVEQTSED